MAQLEAWGPDMRVPRFDIKIVIWENSHLFAEYKHIFYASEWELGVSQGTVLHLLSIASIPDRRQC